MKFNGEFWDNGTATNRSTAGADLTLEALQEMMRLIRDIPPLPKIDLYCHDLNDDQVYEITDKECLPLQTKDRRFMIVPRRRLDFIADAFRKAGCDVRVEPRIVKPDSAQQGEAHVAERKASE